MKKCRMNFRFTKTLAYGSVTMFGLLLTVNAFCQDGVAGINEANTKVRGYFSAGTNFNVRRWCHCGAYRCCQSI